MTFKQGEKINHYSDNLEGEFIVEIDKEFERHKTIQFKGMRKENEKIIKLGFSTIQQMEKDIMERKKYYNSLDLNGRVAELTNNFYFWWPGGYYRELLEKRKNKESPDFKKITSDEKLVQELDNIFHESGYEKYTGLVLDKNVKGEERNQKMRIISDVYLKMRFLGYDSERLRK